MNGKLVTIIGASGFVGRYVVQRLASQGYRIRAAVRRPYLALFLKPMGDVGQIVPIQCNIRDDASVRAAIEGADAVVNLVGILAPSGRQTFQALQADGAARVARLSAEEGVRSLVQVSAIGADAKSPARYANTKAAGEAAVRDAFPDATILRPSLVFGPEDQFFNRFAAMAKSAPAMPLICGSTRFQPVYVGDVAAAVAASLAEDSPARGQLYELGGPRTYTFKELLNLMMAEIHVQRPLIPIPTGMAKIMGAFASLLPNPPITHGQVVMLQRDNVVADGAPGLRELGITPTAVETVIPSYLAAYRPQGQFAKRA